MVVLKESLQFQLDGDLTVAVVIEWMNAASRVLASAM